MATRNASVLLSHVEIRIYMTYILGLYYVEYDNGLKRIAKGSAHWYRDFIARWVHRPLHTTVAFWVVIGIIIIITGATIAVVVNIIIRKSRQEEPFFPLEDEVEPLNM